MRIKNFKTVLICLIPLLAGGNSKGAGATVAELIKNAHKYDNMYVPSSQASRLKAVDFYQQALASGPDSEQRLHILYRMAQLYGSAYQIDKGEKPDFNKAIELYKEIVNSYPLNEPLVLKSCISIGDHYVTQWQFETAIGWYKKTLTYDLAPLQAQVDSLKNKARQEQSKFAVELEKTVQTIRHYQETAVNQVAYSAKFTGLLHVHGELRAISEQYKGSFIAERANKLLAENMDKLSDVFDPVTTLDNPGLAFKDALNIPPAVVNVQNNSTDQIKQNLKTEPNLSSKPAIENNYRKKSRDTPLVYLSILPILSIIVIISVIFYLNHKKQKS